MALLNLVSFFILLAARLANAADPDPLTDTPPNVTDFVLRDLFTNGDVSHDIGGVRAAMNTKVFPGYTSQGITLVRFKMVPCGVNLPHTHPRASELLTLICGGPLQVGFVDTSGMAHLNILYPGDVTIFPRGMMHFELNVGTETAEYISALNSQNPGTLTSGGALFKIPARAVATSLNQALSNVMAINSTLFAYGSGLKMTNTSECVPGRDITVDF